jgi:hypothetical protein
MTEAQKNDWEGDVEVENDYGLRVGIILIITSVKVGDIGIPNSELTQSLEAGYI